MRSANSLALVLLVGVMPLSAQERSASIRLLVQSTPLAGFRHYAGADVWPQLRVGDRLELARESENSHDANAIAITWHGRKLGYLPRRENAALAWGLDRGEPLQARISRLSSHPNPARRVEIEVFLE